MTIDFNNLRKQTAYSLDRLIKKLNQGILPSTEYSSHEVDGEYQHWEGDVLLSKEDIQKDIDEVRQNVMIMLCCFDENNPNYKEVYSDVIASGGVVRFNEDAQETEED